MPNGSWSLLLVAMLVVLTVGQLKWARPTALVAVVHNSVWSGALLLVGSNLIVYKEAGVGSWLILGTGLVGFNVGVGAASFIAERRASVTKPVELQEISLVSRRTLVVLVAIYFVAFVIYLWNIQSRFGLDTLIFDPASIRSAPGPTYLETVPFPVRVLLYLGPLLFAVFAVKGATARPFALRWRVVAMVLLAVSMFALLQRTNLFMGILLTVAVLMTEKRRSPKGEDTSEVDRGIFWKWRRSKVAVTASVAGLLVAAFLSFQLIGGALGKSSSTQAVATGNVSETLVVSGLSSPFLYYSGGIPAFLQLAESTNENWPPPRTRGKMLLGDYNPQTWGAATFAPVFKAIPVAKPWDTINPFIDMGVTINVYTWLEPFYRDFRITGVIIGTVLFGFAIAALYRQRFRSERIFWIQAAFISTVFMCTFVPKINNTLFLAELAFIVLLTLRWPPRRALWRIGEEVGESPERGLQH